MKEYFNDKGEYHRIGGPAVEYDNGTEFWYINDMRHRIDGPAIKCSNGEVFYFLNDKEYSYKEWIRFKKLMAFV